MGRSMYQYGDQKKEKDRQLKQIEKNLKRSLAKQQQASTKQNTLQECEAIIERNENE
jgi:hypothetical protein